MMRSTAAHHRESSPLAGRLYGSIRRLIEEDLIEGVLGGGPLPSSTMPAAATIALRSGPPCAGIAECDRLRSWSRQFKRSERSQHNEASRMNIAWRIYKVWLAAAFPHEFKLAFGDEMMMLTRVDIIANLAKRHGVLGFVRLIADLLLRLPVEYLQRDAP